MPDAPELLQQFAGPLLDGTFAVLPSIIAACQTAHKIYKKLPVVYVRLLIGAILCFFGGFYPMVFAAFQAAEHGGLTTVTEALSDLAEEALSIIEESKKDDKKDDDGDGVADVKQIDGKELLVRKTKLVLAKINPKKVNEAISSIYTVWISVMAVLTIQFARTIALSLTITKFTKKVVDRLVLPIVSKAMPKEYQKWCPVLLDWWCKSIGIAVAWKIQTVVSAFTSALAGGLIVSRALMEIYSKGETKHEDTKIDEIASYMFAWFGFMFQYSNSFDMPFPLNLLLWPLELAEYYIRWSVTNE